jgi:hypothetical protein
VEKAEHDLRAISIPDLTPILARLREHETRLRFNEKSVSDMAKHGYQFKIRDLEGQLGRFQSLLVQRDIELAGYRRFSEQLIQRATTRATLLVVGGLCAGVFISALF